MPWYTNRLEIFGSSRAWLPPLLDILATIPPTLCGGDGCSIFLSWQHVLHLAGTTRPEAKTHLFDSAVAYPIDKNRLRRAAADQAKGIRNPDSGLTGWVAAFDRPLNLRDQCSDNELATHASREGNVPPPVWSNKGGGFSRLPGPSPFLAVPMRYRGDVYGVVRVVTMRTQAQPFTAEHEQRLLEFGGHLAAFFVEQKLLSDGLDHYFRIWAARDGNELVRRITEAVPELFKVDCCSFFERDDAKRFVLQESFASALLHSNRTDYEHFKAFKAGSLGNLFYQAGKSKTGICIQTQAPLLLRRNRARGSRRWGKWSVVVGKLSGNLQTESSGQFLNPRRASRNARCEIRPARSRSILLVPVRDVINPWMLAGVIRVVSTQAKKLDEQNVVELEQFADGLGQRLGETMRQEIQQKSSGRLIEELGNLEARQAGGADSVSRRWAVAAQIICQALDADAATVFLMKAGKLRTERPWSFLNLDQSVEHDREKLRIQHGTFQTFCADMEYSEGEGRTGWPALHKAILNLKDLDDDRELGRFGVTPKYDAKPGGPQPHPYCEIHDPGPFIAAPILLPGSPAVAGVVRALRTRNGYRGPFTGAHELVLSSCTTILGAFVRVSGKPAVVISYAARHAGLKDQMSSILRAVSIEPLSAGGSPPSADAAARFDQFLGRASAAIVIATPVMKSRENGRTLWQTSQNVVFEIGQLKQRLPTRTLILRDETVHLPDVAGDLKQLPFRLKPDGIHRVWPEAIGTLREWLNLG